MYGESQRFLAEEAVALRSKGEEEEVRLELLTAARLLAVEDAQTASEPSVHRLHRPVLPSATSLSFPRLFSDEALARGCTARRAQSTGEEGRGGLRRE
jgi:hypothetical protein